MCKTNVFLLHMKHSVGSGGNTEVFILYFYFLLPTTATHLGGNCTILYVNTAFIWQTWSLMMFTFIHMITS